MLGSLVKHLLRPRESVAVQPEVDPTTPLRLHIGGQEPHPDWKIVNVTPGEHTDYVRSCTDLSPFASGTVAEIYASHVLEHLGYQRELATALAEFHRVLVPGGTLRASVPDLATLCTMFFDPSFAPKDRLHVMRLMFGGQLDENDFHYVGLYEELMVSHLQHAGFADIVRVESLGLFVDASCVHFHGRAISLNVIARKPPVAASRPCRPR